MQSRRRAWLGALAVSLFAAAPNSAQAFTSVEGTLIGDQNFYWMVPGQVWIFPHTLGNIDNRVMLQLGTPVPLRAVQNELGNVLEAALDRPFDNLLDIQLAQGAGFVLEAVDNFNVGMWVTAFAPPLADFVDSGIANTRWGAPGGDLALVDPYTTRLNAGNAFGDDTSNRLQLGRKLDLFASYWLPDLGIEAGAHLWWGSASYSLERDESLGPIDIDVDNNPATGDAQGAEEELDVRESTYALSDFGIGLGAAYTALEGLRADIGLDLNFLGVTYEPNGIDNYLDAGGTGFGINLRAHYDLSERFTVGAFGRFAMQSLSFKPQRQRDGGELFPFFTNLDANDASSLPNPPAGSAFCDGAPFCADPTTPGGEIVPVEGVEYTEDTTNFQLAALARLMPISRVKLYGALGFRRQSLTAETSIGNDWFAELSQSFSTLPFINLGFEGQVTDWLDVFIGANKQWRGSRLEQHFFDSRIPDDQFGPGPAGTQPPPGQEALTNANRRDIQEFEKVDSSTTQLFVGTRVRYKAAQLVGQLDPDIFQRGLYFLSGEGGPTWFWISLIYDWDYETDVEFGNGTIRGGAKPSPHEPAPAAPADASLGG